MVNEVQAHVSVLLNEVLLAMNPQSGKVYIDATFGAGGYSLALLSAADCLVYAIDRDDKVKEFYADLERKFPGRSQLVINRFSNLPSIFTEFKIDKADGFVFDVGMSSMQIENQDRGFSFMKDGPLDMRMGSAGDQIDASTFVNALREEEIADVIYQYGGERLSRRIARAIVKARSKSLIKTTLELANVVRSVVPRGRSKIDPATRTFQAIRIWVNDELRELQDGLTAAARLLNIGGKIVVVSFHSLEDRIVKSIFNQLCCSEFLSSEESFKLLYKKVIVPSDEEVKQNPRARSAKLRAIERLA